MNKLLILLCALVLPGVVQAELSSLLVQFPTGVGPFVKGRTVDVAATSNGTAAQYRFVVQRVEGGPVVPVISTNWTSTNTFAVDTSAANVLPGKHRLLVYVRESAKKTEVLNKYKFFTVLEASEANACAWLYGRTYARTVSGDYSVGTRTSAQLQAGTNLALPAAAAAIKSVYFGPTGNLSVVPEVISATVCVFACLPNQINNPGSTITGTYTCSGGTVNLSASGLVPTLPLSVTGTLSINATTGDLTGASSTFK